MVVRDVHELNDRSLYLNLCVYESRIISNITSTIYISPPKERNEVLNQAPKKTNVNE